MRTGTGHVPCIADPTRKAVVRWALAAVLLIGSSDAHGQCNQRTDDCGENAEPARRWYGWQILLVDGALVGLGAWEVSRDAWSNVVWTYGAYSLGSPVVHVAHHQLGFGCASALAHFLTPLSFLGTTIAPGEGGSIGSPTYRAVMLTLGFVLPTAFDATFLAWDRPRGNASRTSPTVTFHPWMEKQGSGVSLSGTF